MSTRKMIAAVAAVGLLSSASVFAAPTTAQKCGAAIGRAVSTLESNITKEGARACGTARLTKVPPETVSQRVNNGKPATEGRTAAVAKAFNRARTRAYERFSGDGTAGTGDDLASCPEVNETSAQSVFNEAEERANDLCAPGTSIPLSTDP